MCHHFEFLAHLSKFICPKIETKTTCCVCICLVQNFEIDNQVLEKITCSLMWCLPIKFKGPLFECVFCFPLGSLLLVNIILPKIAIEMRFVSRKSSCEMLFIENDCK